MLYNLIYVNYIFWGKKKKKTSWKQTLNYSAFNKRYLLWQILASAHPVLCLLFFANYENDDLITVFSKNI